MASFPDVRRIAESSDRSEGVRMPRILALAVAALLLAAGAVFALSELATLRGAHTVHTTPEFLTGALGAPRPNAPLVRAHGHTGTAARILPSGYAVSSPSGTVRITQPQGAGTPWARFENGTSRTTSYGTEAIVLGGKHANAEQYLTVGRHNGAHSMT